VVFAQVGRDDLVDQTSGEAVAAASRIGDGQLLLRTLHLRLVALRGADHGRRREETARAILARADPPLWLTATAELHLVTRLVECGEVPEARRQLAELEARMTDLRDPTVSVQLALTHSALDLFQSRPISPDRIPPALEAMLAQADRDYFEMSLGSLQAVALLQEGALGQAVERLDQLTRVTASTGFAFGLGLALLARGDTRRARPILLETRPPPRDYTWPSTTVTRLQLAIGLTELDVVRAIHHELLPLADELVVSGTTTTVMGAYAGHLGEASLALGERERARSELEHAVALLDHAGAAYWLERARQALAKAT
jgi:hypothetical protein